jgi:Mrp family chromosome partitioning ATPase
MTPTIDDDNAASSFQQEPLEDNSGRQIIRKGKLILYNSPLSSSVDESFVSVRRYNCFGANLFPGKNNELQLTAGVTSPHPRDGKTMVASNLATFLAVDTQDDTVLVDLSFRRPQIHQIFGIPPVPGILDSLRGDKITLSRSTIKGLWILPLGTASLATMTFDKVIELRETLATLKRQFRFVVIDLPSVLHGDFPSMLSSSLDGYVVVASVGRTKTTEIKQVIDILNVNKVIGFVMNKTSVKN